jgi:alkanesulfonate monooxygenase SsuD/methylene tetrahydromethanopterin reductase-like flavin-dependent oxidoreductase (luciferase family)
VEIDVILDARAKADKLAALGQLAERHGVRGVWVSSLLDSRDPFSNLTPLAQATSKINLGPVAVNPFDTHPVKIASSLLTLNELADGRARIVIGGGGEALEALAIKPARRVRAVSECVEIIKAAASGAPVNYTGELYSVRNLCLSWLEAEAPPVYVGASMAQMLGMSARVADGIMMSDMPAPLVANAIRTLDAGLEKSGKRRPGFRTNAFAAWHVYADRERAMCEARQWLVLRGIFRPWVLEQFLDPGQVELVMASAPAFWKAFSTQSAIVEGVPDSVLDAMVENLTFVSALTELDHQIEKLRKFEAAGLQSIALRLYHDPAESIRLLGERVIPALR